MPTALTAKAMRTKARELGIEGWEDMDKDELSTALVEAEGSVPAKPKKAAPAKKAAAAKKAPAKAAAKAAAKKAPVAESDPDDPNPFRPGSNLHLMVKELMRGGKRSAMVTRLRGKIDLKPRARSGSDFDLDEEIDYRLVRVCQVLTNDHGFTIEKDGRGKDQFVKAVPSES